MMYSNRDYHMTVSVSASSSARDSNVGHRPSSRATYLSLWVGPALGIRVSRALSILELQYRYHILSILKNNII